MFHKPSLNKIQAMEITLMFLVKCTVYFLSKTINFILLNCMEYFQTFAKIFLFWKAFCSRAIHLYTMILWLTYVLCLLWYARLLCQTFIEHRKACINLIHTGISSCPEVHKSLFSCRYITVYSPQSMRVLKVKKKDSFPKEIQSQPSISYVPDFIEVMTS